MSKEAMKLALEALGNSWTEPGNKQYEFEKEAITALREALANEALDKMAENARQVGLDYEPAEKPQRWAVFCQGCRKEWSVSYPHPGKDICVDCDDKLAQQEPVAKDNSNYRLDSPGLDQLYTSPPAQRTWVDLTDEEMREIYKRTDWDMAGGWEYERAIEAKLKEKNNG